MKARIYLFRAEDGTTLSSVFSANGKAYNIGASLSHFLAGQTATVVIEGMANSSHDWETIATATLDDAVEVKAFGVEIPYEAVRARVTSANGKPYINIWVQEV